MQTLNVNQWTVWESERENILFFSCDEKVTGLAAR